MRDCVEGGVRIYRSHVDEPTPLTGRRHEVKEPEKVHLGASGTKVGVLVPLQERLEVAGKPVENSSLQAFDGCANQRDRSIGCAEVWLLFVLVQGD